MAPPDPPPGVEGAVLLGAYDGVLRTAVQRLKYSGETALAGELAGLLAERVQAVAGAGDLPPDGVVPAVTTRSRRRRRGYDQSVLLARSLARRLGLPLARVLWRRPGPPQARAADRTGRRLPGHSFLVRGVPPDRPLLVDDVVTTGETMRAAQFCLRAAGASPIPVAVAATPLGGRDMSDAT